MLVHLAARNETIAIDYRETAPPAITRASFLDARGEADPEKSRNSAPWRRRARLGRRACRWRSSAMARASSRSPSCSRLRSSSRATGIVIEGDVAVTLPRAAARLARWPSSAKIFLKVRQERARSGRPAGADRSCRHACADRRRWPARLLRGPGRREDRGRDPQRRRRDDARRSQELSADDSRAGARHLSRLRDRLHVAALLRRRARHRDAEYSRRLSLARAESRKPRGAASDDRGDEARLCRSCGLSRRSRLRESAARAADLQSLCRDAARRHRSPARQDRRRDQRRQSGAARGRPDRAFLDRRSIRQCRRQHLHAQFQLWPRPGGRRRGLSLEQRARRFCRQTRRHERLRTAWAATPTRPAPASGRSRP